MKPPSFTAVNYSLRPSKTIQRGLVFDGLRQLQEQLDWRKVSYVGFGSIWFTDFILAHKVLGISKMYSIEANEIGYRRAKFNKPYSFVRMKQGYSYDVLPEMYSQVQFRQAPSIVWLDYDGKLTDDMIDELRNMVGYATEDSVLLVTFDASEKHYGGPEEALESLTDLFGTNATRRLRKSDVRGIKLAQTMADLTSNILANASIRISKSNECVPAFKIVYKDKATMVTVGAVFPAPEKLGAIRKRVAGGKWPGTVPEPVVAPHLTSKEVAILQSKLPAAKSMSRTDVQALGFDLEEEQIQAFRQFYRHYPTFAQIIS